MKTFLRLTALPLLGLFCLGLLLAGTGCKSLSESGSSAFASVNIEGKTAEEITAATLKVFGADGYSGGVASPGKMVFDKTASRGTSLAREGLVSGYYGATTINRVRVDLTQLAGGTYRLACKAFMVTGSGDEFFKEEVPVANVRSRPYQSLLNKVAKELK